MYFYTDTCKCSNIQYFLNLLFNWNNTNARVPRILQVYKMKLVISLSWDWLWFGWTVQLNAIIILIWKERWASTQSEVLRKVVPVWNVPPDWYIFNPGVSNIVSLGYRMSETKWIICGRHNNSKSSLLSIFLYLYRNVGDQCHMFPLLADLIYNSMTRVRRTFCK